MVWVWIALGILLGLPLGAALAGLILYFYLLWMYGHNIVRIFQEKPLFITPRGEPVDYAEEVRLRTADGLTLQGCYLRTTASRRLGVVLFGLEFGSNRWACMPYCEHLIANGFDVFTFEPRNQGESDKEPGYEPLQWVTNHEIKDFQAAIAYLKSRHDADPRGIGLFGISKGGSAGLLVAAQDRFVRCFVTDGIFATLTTMIPYMRKWVVIYNHRYWIQVLLPTWFYGLLGKAALRKMARERGCRFPYLERMIPQLAPRPWLMIHGAQDTYIKPPMARKLFEMARHPKELWLVDDAKHNQAIMVAGEQYRRRVLDFFRTHLAEQEQPLAKPTLAEVG